MRELGKGSGVWVNKQWKHFRSADEPDIPQKALLKLC
jgi:hypothetical protein